MKKIKLIVIYIISISLFYFSFDVQATTYYVTLSGSGNNDGSSWANSISGLFLHERLNDALSGDIFYIASGIYKAANNLTSPQTSFQLKSGVKLYGGFSGKETGTHEQMLEQRNMLENKTILSGDIDNNDVIDEDGITVEIKGVNTCNVLVSEKNANSDDTEINGFYITGGQSVVNEKGGGMYNYESSPTIINCVFVGNMAKLSGGGLYNELSNSIISNCTFSKNISYQHAAGMSNVKSKLTIEHCTFDSNETIEGFGGGMYNNGSILKITNCIFYKNIASYSGGGIVNLENIFISLSNCKFDKNISTGKSTTTFTHLSKGCGAGIYNYANDSILLQNNIFSENVANKSGSGMYNNDRFISINNCTFYKNQHADNGALCNDKCQDVVITNCTFSENNSSGNAGGLGNMGNKLVKITNCTFYKNTAFNFGGGLSNVFSNNTIITNCTFYQNKASRSVGGGLYNQSNNCTVTNCIFWENVARTDGQIYAVDSVTYCIIQNETNEQFPGEGNIFSGNPILTPLADNGGLTQTCAIGIGSIAIGTGTTSKIVNGNEVVPATDQRGTTREIPPCIGAYEYVNIKNPYIECVENYKDAISICNADTTIIFNIGKIYNKGNSDLIIDKSKITNNLDWQTVVNIETAINNTEYIIAPNDSAIVTLQYKIPQYAEIKTYYDTISIIHNDISRTNPWKIYAEIAIQKTHIEIIPNAIDFGEIEENEQLIKKIDIAIFDKQIEAEIKEVKLKFGENFILTKTIPIGSFIVKDSILVLPKPNKYGLLEDTLIIVMAYLSCEDTFKIPIKVNVKDIGPVKLQIIASKHDLIKPSRLNYKIPIYINSSVSLSTVTIDTLILNIHKTMFYPKSVDKGKLSINYSDSICEILICNISISNVKANIEEILLTLRGNVLLGEQDSTCIKIAKCVMSKPSDKEIDLNDGYLKLKICNEGGDRLLKTAGHAASVTVIENPVHLTTLELECNVIENGNYSLEIIDILGNSQKVKEWKVTSIDNKKFTFSIPIDSYGNGNYIVVMNTPSAVHIAKFVMLK